MLLVGLEAQTAEQKGDVQRGICWPFASWRRWEFTRLLMALMCADCSFDGWQQFWWNRTKAEVYSTKRAWKQNIWGLQHSLTEQMWMNDGGRRFVSAIFHLGRRGTAFCCYLCSIWAVRTCAVLCKLCNDKSASSRSRQMDKLTKGKAWRRHWGLLFQPSDQLNLGRRPVTRILNFSHVNSWWCSSDLHKNPKQIHTSCL